jgi:hypothetical protein
MRTQDGEGRPAAQIVKGTVREEAGQTSPDEAGRVRDIIFDIPGGWQSSAPFSSL